MRTLERWHAAAVAAEAAERSDIGAFAGPPLNDREEFLAVFADRTAWKILAIEHALLTLSEDVVVYVDVDVYVADPDRTVGAVLADADEALRDAASPSERTAPDGSRGASAGSCFFLAQDAPHTVNSGLVILRRARPEALEMVRRWRHSFVRSRRAQRAWLNDQGALQNAVLQVASRATTPRPRLDGVYTDACLFVAATSTSCRGKERLGEQYGGRWDPCAARNAHARNLCYRAEMLSMGLAEGARSFAPGVCLADARDPRARLNVHDDGAYQEGDWLYHGHDRAVAEALEARRSPREASASPGKFPEPRRRGVQTSDVGTLFDGIDPVVMDRVVALRRLMARTDEL
jgi:hypothetical protein